MTLCRKSTSDFPKPLLERKSMSAAIKLNRIKLIAVLKEALQKHVEGQYHSKKLQEKEIARFNSDLEKWEKAMQAWRNSFREMVPKGAEDVTLDISEYRGNRYENYHCYICKVEYKLKNKVTGKVMKVEQRCDVNSEDAPCKPSSWDYKTHYEEDDTKKIQELTKLIKVLELSDQEKVSTGVYKSVLKYL